MGWSRIAFTLGFMTLTLPLHAQNKHVDPPIEPSAGQWKTWVISSGKDFRVPPPPSASETQAELHALADLISHNDAQAAGADCILGRRCVLRTAGWISSRIGCSRARQPVHIRTVSMRTSQRSAMYDATVAAWESKSYDSATSPKRDGSQVADGGRCPEQPVVSRLNTQRGTQAAATTLAYFLPNEAQTFQTMADQAGWSRVLAGVQFPSDYYAGADLGRKVAERVIAKANADGSDAVWSGIIPTGPCNWKGTNPVNITAANWKPFLLTSPSQSRPPAPPACDSQTLKDDLLVVHNFPRGASAFATNYKAFYWQSPEGLNTWIYRYLDTWLFEDRLDKNPPRAARAYALVSAVQFDTFIASQDGKVHLLVHQAIAAGFGDLSLVPGAQPSQLSVKSLLVFGSQGRSAGLPLPQPCGFHSRRRQGSG